MNEVIFLSAATVILLTGLIWAFRALPTERWQILASLPRQRTQDGDWTGLNLTWYGFFCATAYFMGSFFYLVLMGSIGAPIGYSLAVIAGVLAVAIPASRWVARLVERKKETFSVGGAVFVAILLAPSLVVGLGHTSLAESTVSSRSLAEGALAALAIAYTLGEGLGRLGCISFGCCYGKRVDQLPPLLARLFGSRAVVFRGPLKKASFASGLDGIPIVPIQAITATLYVVCALVATGFFLAGAPRLAFLIALTVSQLWRAYSELWRADYRGEGKLSAYQYMAVIATIYGWVWLLVLPTEAVPTAAIAQGLASVWDPLILMLLQGLWVGLFLFMGCSRVTGSSLRFHLLRHHVDETW